MAKTKSEVPLYEALSHYAQEVLSPFHAPGHMMGRGTCGEIQEIISSKGLKLDVSQILGLDDIHYSDGCTGEAQRLAAEYFGSDKTYFLINGSTCGNQAMFMAALSPGDKVILPRALHSSIQAGLILSGAHPVYAKCPYDGLMGVSLSAEVGEFERLQREEPQVKAWAVTSVTAYGSCADVESLSNKAHANDLPLLVDEAWGPHFGSAPGLPPSAIKEGADIVVHSAHKLLPSALSQGAFLHLCSKRIGVERLTSALHMLQSTSPSYLLLLSLDLARRDLEMQGQKFWERSLEKADYLRGYISDLPGFKVMGKGRSHDYDRTRLVINGLDLGLSGIGLESTLRYRFGIQCEMSDLANVVLLINDSHNEEDLTRLCKALKEISSEPHDWIAKENVKLPFQLLDKLALPDFPEIVMTPREAYFAPKRRVSWSKAVGEVCGELITPYPPGMALLCPGEKIGKEHREYLQKLHKMGILIDGLSDPYLESVYIL
ncbi:aminotransferase class I/II-fold pyridoxal phosphate-dependent enzyme [bacterium]|nr:aminotransferase class I/II-fold pyridoxal phosphate-dependent enzyme [bacterium]